MLSRAALQNSLAKTVCVFLIAALTILTVGCGREEGLTLPVARPQAVRTSSILYIGSAIDVLDGIPRSPYTRSGFYKNEHGLMVYDDKQYSGLPGIDVSAYQGIVDWDAVAASDVEFAIIRIGFRRSYYETIDMDECFEMNIIGAQAAGLDVGVYFFSQAITEAEAIEEADAVAEWLSGYSIDLPVVYDWERTWGEWSRTNDTDGATITACAIAFCERIREHGYEPMVYMNREMAYREVDLAALSGYDWWIAEYNDIPTFYYDYEMLQYSASGTVAGIDGDVDLNIWFREK